MKPQNPPQIDLDEANRVTSWHRYVLPIECFFGILGVAFAASGFLYLLVRIHSVTTAALVFFFFCILFSFVSFALVPISYFFLPKWIDRQVEFWQRPRNLPIKPLYINFALKNNQRHSVFVNFKTSVTEETLNEAAVRAQSALNAAFQDSPTPPTSYAEIEKLLDPIFAKVLDPLTPVWWFTVSFINPPLGFKDEPSETMPLGRRTSLPD